MPRQQLRVQKNKSLISEVIKVKSTVTNTFYKGLIARRNIG